MYWYCQEKWDVDDITDKLTKKQDNLEIKRGFRDCAPISITRETNKIQSKKDEQINLKKKLKITLKASNKITASEELKTLHMT